MNEQVGHTALNEKMKLIKEAVCDMNEQRE